VERARQPGIDQVLVRRNRLGKAAKTGQRLGYAAVAVAVVAFVIGALNDLPTWSVALTTVALAVATGLLVPSIILGYGVKAAARQDRELDRPPPELS
jgi:hypothetical protein